MPTIQGARYRLSQILQSVADQIYRLPGGEILDIGASAQGMNKRAFIRYSIFSIPYYVKGDVMNCPIINEHSMYWESAEMVRQLNERGYVVDYYHVDSKAPIQWEKYDLVIDERNDLTSIPMNLRQKITKVYYATGNHWLFHNLAELNRIRDFQARNGIYVGPERQAVVSYSDEVADYMTYLGTDFQLQLFSQAVPKYQLNISAVYEPNYKQKNIGSAKKKFIWLGSSGLLLKGLDLVVEAFAQMPDYTLYIAGPVEREVRFWRWLQAMLAKYPNLVYLGWVDVGSNKFADLAHQCIGTVYLSGSEGGGGAVVQLAHYGLIPVVTETSTVREELGFVIRTTDPKEIVLQTISVVHALAALPDAELRARSEAAHEFARNHHTRKAYARSLSEFLDLVESRTR